MPADETERVKVWNTFFELAHDEAASLKRLQKPTWVAKHHTFLGGTLDDEKTRSLAVVAWCYLALEARVSHLIDELKDDHVLSDDEALAAHFLPTKEKWALLPKLAGKSKTVSFGRPPQQAIAELASLRNDVLHVKYDHLVKRLPTPKKAVKLFNEFVDAMEDMNVVLGRHPQPDSNVLGIALD